MTGAIRYTCRTEGCANWISFHSDTFLPKEWTCPSCEDQRLREIVKDLDRRAALATAAKRDDTDTF